MAAQHKDYYTTLGIPRTASDDEIKLAYRRLAREHHPDLHAATEKELHTQRMKEVNEAYAVLSSKENRAKYDAFGENWEGGPPPPRSDGPGRGGPSEPESEAFSDFFRTMFRQAERSQDTEETFPSETDIEAVLDLSIEDAVRGTEKALTLMATGLCRNCRGTGRKNKGICPVCGGIGEVRQQREVKTKIPPGLLDGARIRLKGQGNEGPRGRGDLYLRIRLIPDSRFTIDGSNLESDARVMPWQAALGAEISVSTVDGPVRMRIPKGTHTGTRLRLAGKGLGKVGKRGDLFIRIAIDIPDTLTPETEALLKKWEEGHHA